MKNLKSILVLLFSLCLVLNSRAQDKELDKAKGIIHKVKDFYDGKKSYSVQVKYTLYADPESNVEIEDYTGVLVKEKKGFYSKIHHTESLQVSDKYIRVNHDEKAIMYGKTKPGEQQIQGVHMELLFQNFEKAVVTEEISIYKIQLMPAAISQSPYGLVLLEINKKDYSLRKQTLFFSNKIPIKSGSGEERYGNPRLEVSFSNFSENNKSYLARLNMKSYVETSSRGNRVSDTLKNYQFIDTTIQ